MSSFQNIVVVFYDHYDVRYGYFSTSGVSKNHVFFLVFGSQLFCSTFAQHFFGLKLTPEIIVIEIIYQHVWEKSISL